ncbi:bifunctional DNA-formamidopyrimidine glycosylase/DNA-(apurinic or apyrimidinic site) lyase [Marinicella litoralis]|uniref:Formamidopyrimidine-DNA glycosylase n=1 Tax=Marinicella litoralis TaxID=644220 RepID=A0A4R6XYM9_9GAMM|nr:bifunctional DNA-formamidopyrimidine glycosylase/DNA-(apurinic or apyrimidinic site) lyase [Marinicella litoralis]TDR23424.1 DNA-(apurinic or apyrimidinic site) lyase [Marinicella litoralis]
MPELPEVETTVRGIYPWLIDQEITTVNVYNAAMRWPIPPEVNDLTGVRICHVSRRAKYILIELSNQAHLILHLGMSGVIRVVDANESLLKHDHFELVLSHGKALRLNDPRRFGCVLMTNQPLDDHKLLSKLGPEPLSEHFSGRWLKQQAKNKQTLIKNFIMNNQVVVGVGNIYAAESLFLAGIRPTRKVSNISLKQYQQLAQVIKGVLQQAIEVGGTTLKDFKNIDGKPGYFKQELQVYGRAGEACYACGKSIKSLIIGQRASCYCPGCQK